MLYALGERHKRDLSRTMAAVMTICWSECACRRVAQGPDGLREGEDYHAVSGRGWETVRLNGGCP